MTGFCINGMKGDDNIYYIQKGRYSFLARSSLWYFTAVINDPSSNEANFQGNVVPFEIY